MNLNPMHSPDLDRSMTTGTGTTTGSWAQSTHSVIWRTNPSRFDSLMSSLASESDLPNTLTFQLVTEAFYGMANESFSALLRDAYPAPTERQFTQIQD